MKHCYTVLVIFILYGCKKEPVDRTITIQVTNIPSGAILDLRIHGANSASPEFSVQDLSTDGNYTTGGLSGQTLDVAWGFIKQDGHFGEGNITIAEGSQTLLNINGGTGSDTITIP